MTSVECPRMRMEQHAGRRPPLQVGARFLVALLAALVGGWIVAASATAATGGPNLPVVAENLPETGKAWSNVDSVTAPDGNYATVILQNGEVSDALQATGFGFDIPPEATILGIEVSVLRGSSSGTSPFIRDHAVRLVKGGTPAGDDRAVGTKWPTTLAEALYGGPGDLWGSTWTPEDVSSEDFGIVLAAAAHPIDATPLSASVDAVQITVTYEVVLPTRTLTYTAGTGGSIEGESTQTVSHGEDGTAVTAVPDVGYRFVDWDDDRADNPRTDTFVTADVTVEARFAVITHTVTFDLDGGTRTGGGELTQVVAHGQAATAPTLTPPEGQYFTGWNTPFANITAPATVTARYQGRTAIETGGDIEQDGGVTITHRLLRKNLEGEVQAATTARSELPFGTETEGGLVRTIVTHAFSGDINVILEVEAHDDGRAVHRLSRYGSVEAPLSVSEATILVPGAETVIREDGSVTTQAQGLDSTGRRVRAMVQTLADGESATWFELLDEDMAWFTLEGQLFEPGNKVIIESDDSDGLQIRIDTPVTRSLRF